MTILFYSIYLLLYMNIAEPNVFFNTTDIKSIQKISTRLYERMQNADYIENLLNNYILHKKEWNHNSKLQCIVDLYWLHSRLFSGQPDAIKTFDSFGKMPSGIIPGNIKWLGKYDECVDLPKTEGNFTFTAIIMKEKIKFQFNATNDGQYCQLLLKLPGIINGRVPVVQYISRLYIGLCLPMSCATQFLSHPAKGVAPIMQDLIRPIFNEDWALSLGIEYDRIICPTLEREYSPTHVLAVIAMVFFVLLILVFTAITFLQFYYQKKSIAYIQLEASQETNDSILNNFQESHESIQIEYPKYFTYCQPFTTQSLVRRWWNDEKPRSALLDGIKIFAALWLILGNTYFMAFSATQNPLDMIDIEKHGFFYQLILQAPLCVQAFFVVSGYLNGRVSLNKWTENENNRTLPMFLLVHFANRFMRLWPNLAILMLFYLTVFHTLADGPLWPVHGFEIDNCVNTWFSTLFFFQNYYPSRYYDINGMNHTEYCMEWTWFIAVDIQLYLCSIPLLILLLNGRSRALQITSAIIAGLCTCTAFFIHYLNAFPPNLFSPDLSKTYLIEQMSQLIYYQLYAHAPAYVGGLCLADWHHNHLLKSKANWRTRMTLYSALFLAIALLLSIWPEYKGYPFPRIIASIYDTFGRLIVSLAVIMLIERYADRNSIGVQKMTKEANLIRSGLNRLGKLVYIAALIHPILMIGYYYSRSQPLYYDSLTMAFHWLGFTIVTFAISAFLHVFIEIPCDLMRQKYLAR